MPLPLVAIVGRPNVGKSTLFNRIVQKRHAIVDNQPGVTRDRKYIQADWTGRSFMLIDTGGYVPDSQDLFEKAIVQQVASAISEAALIVFLVDGNEGMTAIDEEVATMLKRSGKPVILVVNKIDNRAKEINAAEFYKLGIQEQLLISALNGRSIGDFLDVVVNYLPQESLHPESEDESVLSLAIIGRPNVGKSSFVNAILGHEKHIVTEIPGTTRDAIDTVLKYYGEKILLIDTAGLRKKSKVKDDVEFYSTVRSMQSIRRCDVAILIIDATQGIESQDLKILTEAVNLRKGIILAVNKWDLIAKETNTAKKFEDDIRDKLKSMNYLPIIFISALTKQRITKVIDIAKSVSKERGKSIKTSELNKFLEEIIRHYPPPSMDKKEVKLNYCTQIKTSPPVIAFFSNAPESIKANYRSYIENRLREKFGFFGVPLSLVFRKK